MDRWGPSEDCPNCGRTRSYGDFVQCARCDKTICKDCRSHHLCERSNISYKDIVDKLKAKIPEIGMGYYPSGDRKGSDNGCEYYSIQFSGEGPGFEVIVEME